MYKKRIFNKNSEKQIRKSLRNEMPKAELSIWYHLRNRQLKGFKFRRQYSVNNYIVDFYCPQLKLAIEIDGDSHFQNWAAAYDKERQKIIESFGVTFLRFTNTDIYNNINEVLKIISDHIDNLKPPPPTPPL